MGNKTERSSSERDRASFKAERNSMKQTLLCFKKAAAPESLHVKYLPTVYIDADEGDASEAAAGWKNRSEASCQKRNALHQDVEEALNSLLWQPYEYQNVGVGAVSSDSSSYLGSSSACSDLEQITDNDDGTPTRCNFTDPHLPTPTTRMVINPRAAAPRADQSHARLRSRDATAILPTAPPSEPIISSSRECARPVALHGDAKTSDMSDGSLRDANVVGLPSHCRFASEPSGYQYRHGPLAAAPPQVHHARSSSAPKAMPVAPNCGSTAAHSHPRLDANVSNVNVNFYRAVPVNVVSSVPTIRCLNSSMDGRGNDVSNVQVLPLGLMHASQVDLPLPAGASTSCIAVPAPSRASGTGVATQSAQSIAVPAPYKASGTGVATQSAQSVAVPASYRASSTCVATQSSQSLAVPAPSRASGVATQSAQSLAVPAPNRIDASCGTVRVITACQPSVQIKADARTFTSTEAQTDDIAVPAAAAAAEDSGGRERRRRDRRQRRGTPSDAGRFAGNPRLPDLLNSHQPPPPYGGHQLLPPPHLQTVVPNNVVPHNGFMFQAPSAVVPGHAVSMVQGPAPVAVPHPAATGFRFPFPVAGFSRGRFPEDHPKGCCGILSWKPGSLRWFIALIALVAVCCVLVGTALGAMRPSGRDHLTVSLLMIGVGIVLVTVSGVAWRLTSHDSTTCCSMLGLRSGNVESAVSCASRFVPRLPPSYGRPHHPYAAMMYPEFQYRPPPPSYQASMQEYRLRLLLLERGGSPQMRTGAGNAISPPPTYRSHAGSLLRVPLSARRDACQSEYSCPPSYRSQNSTHRQSAAQSDSREHSISISESDHGGSIVNIVNILGSACENGALDTITLDSFKMEPDSDLNPVKMLLGGNASELEGSKGGNLVTIVQTGDRTPVIVTVSGNSQIGSSNSVRITEIPSEIEILAHL